MDRLFRTITAACTETRFDDLIAQTCASTSVASVLVPAQPQVLELELIGFVLP
ncbi:hypothetical protein [Micromonospora sp. DPT]|uniref:hypothetical protein n=1 Tax=Micromonospora sp. DPT TaxID=3142975 RepID=UPI003209E10E